MHGRESASLRLAMPCSSRESCTVSHLGWAVDVRFDEARPTIEVLMASGMILFGMMLFDLHRHHVL